jgi:hypothetical protein
MVLYTRQIQPAAQSSRSYAKAAPGVTITFLD